MKKKYVRIIIVCSTFIIASVLLYTMLRPTLIVNRREGKRYNLSSDSLAVEGNRQCGWIRLDNLINLVSSKQNSMVGTQFYKDSVVISVNSNMRNMFFGADDGDWWRKGKYINLPITFPNNHSFKSKFKQEGDHKYIYIPYQILVNLASYFNVPPGETYKRSTAKEITIQNIEQDVPQKTSGGKKIQTEGIVRNHVSEILAKKGLNSQSASKQMEVLWRHAKDNWLYIHDPYIDGDTWRSAEDTINDYYFSNKLQYSGDCDDFAILMASFARQIGLDSSVKVVIGAEGGHAYAQFKDEDGYEIPLDWFSNEFGGTPYQGEIFKVYKDI